MPYVTCPDCTTSAYTAARFSTSDDCPRCGASLRGARRDSERVGYPPATTGFVSAFTNSSSCAVVQHS
jgi:hypothetical protein